MTDTLYAIFGMVVLACFAAWAFVFGTKRATLFCLFLLPFRVTLPESIGHVIGFENLVLVPDLLVPIVFAVWLLKRLATSAAERFDLVGEIIPIPFLLVIAAFLLSYRPGIVLRDFLSDLQKWSVYALAFVLVSRQFRGASDLTKTVNALLAGGAVTTVRDVAAYFSIFELPSPLGYAPNRDAYLYSAFAFERYQGTGWPFFINALLLFILARLVASGSTMTAVKRWTLTAYAGVLVTLLALSFYRGDWVALGAACLAGLAVPGLLSRRLVRAGVGVTALSVLAMILIGSGVLTKRLQERFQTVFRPASEEHVLARLDAMAEGVRMFRQHPVTGIGLGQFGANFERYAGAQVYGVAVDPSFYRQANNDYLQYLATTGVVGFVALTILFGTFLLRAYRLIALTLDEQTRAVLIGCFLSTVAFAVTALSQDPLWDKTYGTLLFTDLALIWSVRGEGL